MGRPLRYDAIEKMGLNTSKGQLGKQVGYNKYLVLTGEKNPKYKEGLVVRLAEADDEAKNEVVLTAKIGNGVYTVLKLMKHLIQTTEGAFEYTLDEEGKALDKDGNEITFGSSSNNSAEPAQPTPEPAQSTPEPEQPTNGGTENPNQDQNNTGGETGGN